MAPPESVEELPKEIRSLREQLQKALAENQRLRQQLEEAVRSLKRPGRKPGAQYGQRALRPAVIARITWGGNRTPAGAQSQQILASLLRTCWQQGKDTFQR
ncbi:MAG: hypothetical protein EXQ58_02445, partial [Acidobacteria bacterium]|nr:hypothetical protein [Acidobacteriota bacterium]